MMSGKQMIRISTDATNLTTDCIGIISRPKRHRGRGRPKGSKSKNKTKRTNRKRSAIDSSFHDTDSYDLTPTTSDTVGHPPKRKKRKPNRAHREQFPHHTDEDIRRKLALERKAKNRKSAQESRERRKKQEEYLNERLPKGLALKALLKSDKMIHPKSEDVHLSTSDDELSQMKMILHQMVDNNAVEYDQYANVLHQKSAISDDLICNLLNEYLDDNESNTDDDAAALHLETDHDAIHLQVISEIEDGIPIQVDDIPPSATPNSFKATRGRKPKHKEVHNTNSHNMEALKTPPTLPQIVDAELPPPVFGVGNIDFNIDSESAVSLYPEHQDSMMNQYHFQSLYNANNHAQPQYPLMYHPMNVAHINHINHINHHHHHTHHPEATPSTISTNSTISNPMTTITNTTSSSSSSTMETMKEDVCELQDKVLMSLMNPTQKVNHNHSPSVAIAAAHHSTGAALSPLYTIGLHTPEQMHFIVPHSPIISVTAQQDTEETKQMLMDGMNVKHTNNGMNGRNSRNGKNFNNINNGEIVYDITATTQAQQQAQPQPTALDPMEEMRILSILVQIVQSFIIIICGMAMAVNLSIDTMKTQYQAKINKATEDLRILVMDFMRKRLKEQEITRLQWMEVQQHIIQSYLPEVMVTIKNHPLLPNTQMMDVSLHYQAYRQIAMEILQNMKQEAIQYQMKIDQQHPIKAEMNPQQKNLQQDTMELMMGFDAAPIPAVIPMMQQQQQQQQKKQLKIEEEQMTSLDLNSSTSAMSAIHLRSICSEYHQIHTQCLEEFQMNPMMDYSSIHSVAQTQAQLTPLTHLQLIKYKTNLQDKCFKILLGGKKLKEKE